MDPANTDTELNEWLRWASEGGRTLMFVRMVARETHPARVSQPNSAAETSGRFEYTSSSGRWNYGLATSGTKGRRSDIRR
jgi:hypothetical protein